MILRLWVCVAKLELLISELHVSNMNPLSACPALVLGWVPAHLPAASSFVAAEPSHKLVRTRAYPFFIYDRSLTCLSLFHRGHRYSSV